MPPGPGKALLFDIDGTLADTDAPYSLAFNQVASALAVTCFDATPASPGSCRAFQTRRSASDFLPMNRWSGEGP